MIRTTGDLFYILIYQHDNGELYWWALFDSLEAAAEDAPLCYESRTHKDVIPEHRKEMIESLLKDGRYSDESGGLNLWIDEVPLCTNK